MIVTNQHSERMWKVSPQSMHEVSPSPLDLALSSLCFLINVLRWKEEG